VVLAVQEVNLVCKFTDGLLVCLMGVANTEHLQVLATFIQALHALNFFFPHYHMLFCLLKLILDLQFSLLRLFKLHPEAVASLVRFSEFFKPLLVRLSRITFGHRHINFI